MQSMSRDPSVASKTTDADEHRRLALEIRESRESLIFTFRTLPPVCREHVLNGESARRRFVPYERLESFFGRLRDFHSGHAKPDVSRFVEQARRSRGRMNRAREALVLANLGIVPHVVRQFCTGTISLGDLVQDGNIGLLKAVDRFDPDRGARFSTYACWWIRRALNDAYACQARSIHLPDHVRRDLRRLRETTRELECELERPPLDDEVASRTGLSIRKIKSLRFVPPDPSALEDIAEDRADGWQGVVGGAGTGDPFEVTLKGELHEQAAIALEQLSPRERYIVKSRFGFQGGNGMTLQQIADTIGVSRERVRQIECAAMGKISRWAKRAHIANC
jgi:RNA polymerase primary sigma factor